LKFTKEMIVSSLKRPKRILYVADCGVCPHKRWTIKGPDSLFCDLAKVDFEHEPETIPDFCPLPAVECPSYKCKNQVDKINDLCIECLPF